MNEAELNRWLKEIARERMVIENIIQEKKALLVKLDEKVNILKKTKELNLQENNDGNQ